MFDDMCDDAVAAAMLRAVQEQAGLAPLVSLNEDGRVIVGQAQGSVSRSRREYRGRIDRLSVDGSHAFKWISAFEQYYGEHVELCRGVIAKHDADVMQYGYSLQNLSLVRHTGFLGQYNMLTE